MAFIANFIPGLANGLWITGAWLLTPFQSLVADLGQFVLLPVVTALLLFRLPTLRTDFRALAWPKRSGDIVGSVFVGAVAGACGLFAFRFIGNAVEAALALHRSGASLMSVYDSFPTPVVAAFYLAGTACIAEEFVYRYLPLAFLAPADVSNRGKWIGYLAASCLMFGLIHWEYGVSGVVSASLWGFMLGFMFWAFRNPVTVVVAHFTGDLILFWP